MAKTPKELRAEAAELVKQADAIEKAAIDPYHALASELHSLTCHWNHTDGCGWFYENDSDFEKPGTTRNGYFSRAKKICHKISKVPGGDKMPMKDILALIKIIHETRD